MWTLPRTRNTGRSPWKVSIPPAVQRGADIRLDGTRYLDLTRFEQHGSSRYWNHVNWGTSIHNRIDLRRHPRFREDDGRICELLPIPMYFHYRLDHYVRILSNRNWRCRFQFRPLLVQYGNVYWSSLHSSSILFFACFLDCRRYGIEECVLGIPIQSPCCWIRCSCRICVFRYG
jgi:hypothetical protein